MEWIHPRVGSSLTDEFHSFKHLMGLWVRVRVFTDKLQVTQEDAPQGNPGSATLIVSQ